MLIVPQKGRLLIATEFGAILAAPGEIAVIQRGIRFRVELPDGPSRGFVCENYGASFRLPERGPIGANGLANPRDFRAPVARYEDREGEFEIVTRFQGNLWAAPVGHSPLDVVAWHGNYVPYKYDLGAFNAIGTVSFDHPDPSIYTVLTSPSDLPGTANVDFVIFPPRWMVAEDTFRPPWFHRNTMSEFLGLGVGQVRRQGGGFRAGRGEPPQRIRAARAGRGRERQGDRRRARAAISRRHDGLHVRDPLRLPPDRLRAGDAGAPARLPGLLAGPAPDLRSRIGRLTPSAGHSLAVGVAVTESLAGPYT